MSEEKFLSDVIKDFYANHQVEVPNVDQREFGIGFFGKKIAKRHLSFSSQIELTSFLKNRVPFYISYSVACYEKPASTPMDAKGFLGADIVYEFDADDLKTDCKQDHDSWICTECGAKGKGSVEKCSKCGSSVQVEQWFCFVCLNETKKQVFRLLEFIENDLSLHEGISINFSGNAGYHIHLRNDSIKSLNAEARIELLDYLTTKDFDLQRHGFVESNKMFLCPMPNETHGWNKRLLTSLVDLIEKDNVEKIAAFGGVRNATVRDLLSNKELVLKNIKEKGILFSIPGRKNKQFWESLLQHLLEESALDIDRQTSADIRKIIRVPETIHGGSGLLAKNIPLEQLKEFNPLDETVVFPDTSVKVFISSSPKFYLKGNWFGPFTQEEAELPLYAAFYLIARKSASLVG